MTPDYNLSFTDFGYYAIDCLWGTNYHLYWGWFIKLTQNLQCIKAFRKFLTPSFRHRLTTLVRFTWHIQNKEDGPIPETLAHRIVRNYLISLTRATTELLTSNPQKQGLEFEVSTCRRDLTQTMENKIGNSIAIRIIHRIWMRGIKRGQWKSFDFIFRNLFKSTNYANWRVYINICTNCTLEFALHIQ